MYRGKTAHREEPIITCAFRTPFCRDASCLDQLRQQRGSILRIGWHQFLNSALHNTTTRLDRIFITASSHTTMTRSWSNTVQSLKKDRVGGVFQIKEGSERRPSGLPHKKRQQRDPASTLMNSMLFDAG